MKKIYSIILLLFFAFPACQKNIKTDGLTGSWELSGIYNPALSTPVPRPAGATRKFLLKFSTNNAVSGNTFNNTFNGSYTLANDSELRFGIFDATQIQEDIWGKSFNEVLISCALQSLSPCTPSLISIRNDELKITTPYYSELTFKRIQ